MSAEFLGVVVLRPPLPGDTPRGDELRPSEPLVRELSRVTRCADRQGVANTLGTSRTDHRCYRWARSRLAEGRGRDQGRSRGGSEESRGSGPWPSRDEREGTRARNGGKGRRRAGGGGSRSSVGAKWTKGRNAGRASRVSGPRRGGTRAQPTGCSAASRNRPRRTRPRAFSRISGRKAVRKQLGGEQ